MTPWCAGCGWGRMEAACAERPCLVRRPARPGWLEKLRPRGLDRDGRTPRGGRPPAGQGHGT